MVDIFTPLRAERVIDSNGRLTIRFADYLDNIKSTVNETVVNVEAAEGVFSELQSVAAISHEQNKRIDDIDQLSIQISQANAKIAELQKQVNNLDELI